MNENRDNTVAGRSAPAFVRLTSQEKQELSLNDRLAYLRGALAEATRITEKIAPDAPYAEFEDLGDLLAHAAATCNLLGGYDVEDNEHAGGQS